MMRRNDCSAAISYSVKTLQFNFLQRAAMLGFFVQTQEVPISVIKALRSA
jgi:hypothetical protein